jgi:hypothetical protein
MATDNRGVMVYLPSELEAKMAEYCTEYNITRKDKQGNIVTSLGSGIVAYLKSQLLGDLPRSISDRPINGLTRAEVLDLIAESSTSNTPTVGVASPVENRSPNPTAVDVVHRLETVEQQLLSLTGISRDEVEQLIQASEQRVLETAHILWAELRGELAGVKTVDDSPAERLRQRINIPPIETSSSSQEQTIEDTDKLIDSDRENSVDSDLKPMSKGLRRWLEPLKDNNFRGIIQVGISEKWRNQEIVTKLFEAGYGKDNNTNPYPKDLASAMKTALRKQAISSSFSTI